MRKSKIPRPWPSRNSLLLLLGASIALPLYAAETTALVGPSETVPQTYFGLHIHRREVPWPSVPFGSIRLGASGVSWDKLQPEQGKWNFQPLDAWVELARKQNVKILLPLGGPPPWASARPNEDSADGKGRAGEPANIDIWRDHVRTIAARYKGRIEAYEIWNEPNAKMYYTGTIEQMVAITCTAYKAIKDAAPDAIVVSPAATMRSGVDWLNRFLRAGGKNCIDVVGYHFYVFPGPPEAMVPLIRDVKKVMADNGVGNKQLWNTESGWAAPKQFSSSQESVAYVARAYILNWAAGVARFYWYVWDEDAWTTLKMTANGQPTAAARAYGQIEQWMLWGRIRGCKRDQAGNWVCELSRDSVSSWIAWNDETTLRFAVPEQWHLSRSTPAAGTPEPIVTNSVWLGPVPQLLQTQ